MKLHIQRHFPTVTEPLTAVRWAPLDSAAILSFSHNTIVIVVRNQFLTPALCKCVTFDRVVDVQFLPFAGNCLAVLTDSAVHVVDWLEAKEKIAAEEDKALMKVSGVEQMYMCGLHINERTIKMGEYNHLLMVSKARISLLDVSLEENASLKQVYSMPLVTDELNENLLSYFDIYYGLLYTLESNTGKLKIYQYKHNQGAHSFEEFYTKPIELDGKATGLSAIMEGFGRLGSNIRVVVADTQGVKFCRVSTSKALPRVDEKILNLEIFRPKTNTEIIITDIAAPALPTQKLNVVASEPVSISEASSFGMPPGLGSQVTEKPDADHELISVKLADIFAFNSETANPPLFQESLPLVEEKSNPVEEDKAPTVTGSKDASINEKLAELMNFGNDDIPSLNPPSIPRPHRGEYAKNPKGMVANEKRVDKEEIRAMIKETMEEVVRRQIGGTILPAMENSFKRAMSEIRSETTEDAVKFLKQRELEYAKMDSICSLYEMNMQKLTKQHKEYTEMVIKILKDNAKSQVAKTPAPVPMPTPVPVLASEEIPVIPTISSEPISALFLPEILDAPEGKSMIKEGIWNYPRAPEVHNPYQIKPPYSNPTPSYEQPYNYYQPAPFEPPETSQVFQAVA
eukprot:TRINITY_DN2402_c0_g2_i9.p1 TRINITY_DN2402_c0_g2~~TRINITY_DN2402_c0_g2_i9.p1  ORF type:complete len:627 (-),score=125.39 TRINITY_DN2402_c0_g2_i9:527-2407(-)